MPKVEFKRKSRLTRQEAADRLIALGNALAAGSEIELSSGGDSVKIGVASQLNWELEIEIDGDETELEIELKWTDDPRGKDDDDKVAAATPEPEPAPTPVAEAGSADEAEPAVTAARTPARRGRPRKTPAAG